MSDDALPAAEGASPSQVTDATPRLGCLFFLVPVGFTGAILLAYVILFGAGGLGGSAGGDRVTITFDACTEAKPLVQARVDQMGLGSPAWADVDGGFTLQATLPGTPADATIPQTLARGGDFRVIAGPDRGGEQLVGPDGIEKAELSLKELGNPLVVITLTREAQKGLEQWMEDHVERDISVWVDTERVMLRPADPPFRRQEVDIRAEGDDGVDNLRRAADWGIVMTNGPLPCPVSVREVRPTDGA